MCRHKKIIDTLYGIENHTLMRYKLLFFLTSCFMLTVGMAALKAGFLLVLPGAVAGFVASSHWLTQSDVADMMGGVQPQKPTTALVASTALAVAGYAVEVWL